MNINELYDTAKRYSDILKKERPGYISDDSCLCLIVGERQEIFSGVTGIRITGEKAEDVHAEFNAVMSLKNAGQSVAKQMITVKIADGAIIQPCNDCLDLLIAANNDNSSCAVVVDTEKAAAVTSIRYSSSADSMDFLSGFGDDFDDTSSDDSVAEVVIDASNPFYSSEKVTEAVKTFADKNSPNNVPDVKPMPMAEGPIPGPIPPAAAPSSAPAPAAQPSAPAMSMEDIQKQAKKRKKIAKSNFKFFGR